METTGYPVVTLCVSSTEDDATFFVYLEDVDESGVVRYITEGILREVHRRLSDETPSCFSPGPYRTFKRRDLAPLPPGETVELSFALLPTSVLLRRGQNAGDGSFRSRTVFMKQRLSRHDSSP
ncbi:MAG: putative serine esterase [Firmicutes bacterium]|nr:putative serine esterase [Bacillota bacterium]